MINIQRLPYSNKELTLMQIYRNDYLFYLRIARILLKKYGKQKADHIWEQCVHRSLTEMHDDYKVMEGWN